MSELLKSYGEKVDASDFDVQNTLNGFRTELTSHFQKMDAENDKEGIKYLELEQAILNIKKSVEDGLSPSIIQTGKAVDGKEIESIWPDFTIYGDTEYNY